MKKFNSSNNYLKELNYRLAYATFGGLLFFFITYTYKESLIFLILPKGLSYFVSSELTEIFYTYVRLCAVFSLNFTIILILTQVFFFFRPSLYIYESEIAFDFLIFSILLYLFLYILLFPWLIKVLWKVFSDYSKKFEPIHLEFEPRLDDYLKHIVELNETLTLSFPCILGLKIVKRYTNGKLWIKYRKISYITALFIGAFITPPDILSQIIVGLNLIILYEIQIIFWIISKNCTKKKFNSEANQNP